ncbi:uncharacterized protein LOC135703345 [Ochlerotatus camptorhynchus]|uniref:uncharacterized protein LOC135703345 n=1 Tax=Ochlerotatus camptorhynchus TaxID=644619 RepID=UPI0031D5B4F9
MSSSLHIDDLPAEAFEHILDFVPLSVRKVASLVCRRWCLQAFSHRYMGRAKLRMINWKSDDILQRSWRPYRNLEVNFGPQSCTDVDLELLVKVLRRFETRLESFTCSSALSPKQLRDAVLLMPNLKKIKMAVIDHDGKVAEPLPILNELIEFKMENNIMDVSTVDVLRMMPNVRHLSANLGRCIDPERSFHVLRVYAPQLKSLEMFALDNVVPIEKLDLRMLESLKLTGKICNLDEMLLQQFFAGVPLLKTGFLSIYMTRSVLAVIGQNCPQLTTLSFRVYTLNEKLFRCLEGLQHLKVLHIYGHLVQYMLKDCKPLHSVRTFSLDMYERPFDYEQCMTQLNRVLPNLIHLKVASWQLDNALVRQICTTFTKLRRLKVADIMKLSAAGFDRLADIVNLEELTLSGMRLPIDSLPTSNLKRLKLENFRWLDRESLLQVGMLFPCLQYLELFWCELITWEDVAVARHALPNCIIHYVE